jgi:hypothetical protein
MRALLDSSVIDLSDNGAGRVGHKPSEQPPQPTR